MTAFTREQWEDGLLRVQCIPRPWSDDIAVYFTKKVDYRAARSVLRFVETEEALPDGGLLPPEPSLALHARFAQNLMDELWRAGIRPSDSQTDGDTQLRHLEDMRAILFSKLNVERP